MIVPLKAALLGNPNTGKTTLFNALTGLNHRVGNYPGVTVEPKIGSFTCGGREATLIDLPGTYSLAARSPDEMVAVDVVLGRQPEEPRPQVLVCIVDASNLDRNLYLATQAMELGLPLVIALNMIDVAEAHGLKINVPLLSERLGVPVVPIQANQKKGLDELRRAIAHAANSAPPSGGPCFPQAFENEVAALRGSSEVPDFLLRRLLLDVGGYTEQAVPGFGPRVEAARLRLNAAGCPVPAVEARTRYAWIRQATAAAVERPAQRPVTWTDRLDAVLTHRLWGTLIFLVVMLGLFLAMFSAAKPIMKLIDAGREALAKLVGGGAGRPGLLPPGPFTSLLAEGVIGGVGAVVVFLPQVLILFAILAVLEDCGYMARAAFLMDRLMSRCGLSGKSFIPMLSSLACAVPGILGARVIEDRRDRLVTILVAPLMSCSARLPVYTLLIGAFLTAGYSWWVPGLTMFAMYAIGLVAAPLVALALKGTILPGAAPVFVMEMPEYKWPTVEGVLRRVWEAGTAFLARAGTIILAASIVVWVLLNFPRGDYPERIEPLKQSIWSEQERVAELKEALEEGTDAEAAQAELDGLLKKIEPVEAKINDLDAEWKEQSYLGTAGRFIEPAVRPLGWDWRLGVAALASFPAREVVVGVMGVVFHKGKTDTEDEEQMQGLGESLREANFGVPTALSMMVFFALCCQCASTLAVIYRETKSWEWPAFTFAYMTALAYAAALVVFQVASLFVG